MTSFSFLHSTVVATIELEERTDVPRPDVDLVETTNSRHRADIQGLRGIAVLLVVLFHVEMPGFSGGFVGVDVFFVISGFVIGRSMLRELDQTGTIRLGAFWIRRARRLVPAFFAMMLTTLLASIFLLQLGAVQQNATRTALAGTFSAANLFLNASADDYFGADQESNPYLHLWSLGVEEQFYLVLPLLVIAAVLLGPRTRWPNRTILTATLGALSFASLVWGQRLIDQFEQAESFYLPTSRFWEMAAGVLLALAPPLVRSHHVAAVASIATLGLTVLAYSKLTEFPGFAAIPVVVATAVIIAAAPTTRWLEDASSQPWLIWIGDRSYGWYLWHWPLIVMARQTFGPSLHIAVLAATSALIPTALSYRLIERPVLTRRAIFTPRRVAFGAPAFVVALAVVASVVNVGANEHWGRDLPVLEPDGIAYTSGCHTGSVADRTSCTFEPSGASLGTVVLAGDSHAASLADGVIAAGNRLGYTVVVSSDNICPFVDIRTSQRCQDRRSSDDEMISEVDAVAVLMAHSSVAYPSRAEGNRPIVRDADNDFVTDRAVVDAMWAEAISTTRSRLDDLGVELISIDTVPAFTGEITMPTLLTGAPSTLTLSRHAHDTRQSMVVDREHDELSPGRWIDPAAVLCTNVCTTATADGSLLYFDATHLSRAGSLRLTDHLVDELQRILTP